MNTTQRGIATLLRCGITGEKLPLPDNFSLEEAIPELKKHSVLALAYQGAVHCGLDKSSPAMQKMLLFYYQILMQHERQNLALERLFAAFEEAGIAYMPVKGCNMKKLYPKPELRPMGDADILIHVEDYSRIQPIMEKLGFTLKADSAHAYEWTSADLMVELHKSLVVSTTRDFYKYYGTGWKFAVPGTGMRFDLSAEDSYIFTFVHFANHYRSGGIGCRHITDLFVYRRAIPLLDMNYIHKELKKLNLLDFHKNIMTTIDVWFGETQENQLTQLITDFVFSSGNWGTLRNKFLYSEFKSFRESNTTHYTRFGVVIHRLFPSLKSMSYSYKPLRTYPILLPLFWVIRWLELLTIRRKSIGPKLRAMKQTDQESLLNCEQALQIVGLYDQAPEA